MREKRIDYREKSGGKKLGFEQRCLDTVKQRQLDVSAAHALSKHCLVLTC